MSSTAQAVFPVKIQFQFLQKNNADLGFRKPLLLSAKHGFASKVHTGTNVLDPKFKIVKSNVTYTM